MNAARFFMRREDYQPPATHADSPFRRFTVRCLQCESFKLRVVSSHDDDTGETKTFLVCSRCGEHEELPTR